MMLPCSVALARVSDAHIFDEWEQLRHQLLYFRPVALHGELTEQRAELVQRAVLSARCQARDVA